MTRDEMLADLAYARSVAEEGRQAPLIGGSFLVFFGVMLAICYGLQWLALSGTVPGLENKIGLMWMIFGLAAFVGSWLLGRRVSSMPGRTAIGNRVDRVVWQGTVFAIFAVVTGAIVRGVIEQDMAAPNVIAPAGFGLYGVALFATAALSGHAWLRTFAALSFLLSAALWFGLDQPWMYLLAATGCVLVLIAPGVAMMRAEPQAPAAR